MDDFRALEKMVYSGRGIVVGMTLKENPFIGYTLTGRSKSSQARELVYDEEEGVVRTAVTDPNELKKGNPLLLIYPALAYTSGALYASNGTHTNLMLEHSQQDPHFNLANLFSDPTVRDGVDLTTYEPDAPHYTPRISGRTSLTVGELYAVRRDEHGLPRRTWESFALSRGKGKLITTYKGGNEHPLLPFDGRALDVVVDSLTSKKLCENFYRAIGPKDGNNYRVAAAVMMLRPDGLSVTVINQEGRGN